jgi:GAG-pre-integrase domain
MLCPKAGLYALDQRSSIALKVLKKPYTESLELWHRRYSHINYGYIRETAHIVSGLYFLSTKVELLYNPCELSKSTRSFIYPKEDPPSVLDILIIDI